jgi:hypothetical protein
MKTTLMASILAASVVAATAQGNSAAWNVPAPAKGNDQIKDLGVLNDFQVIKPVTVDSLGYFDSDGDGIQGASVITVQLYQRSRKPHLLLESMTFDAANPGELAGSFRFRKLAQPLTLLPGTYIIYVRGFDENNPNYNFTLAPEAGSAPAQLNLQDGGGSIRFLGCNRSRLEYGLPKPTVRNPPIAAEPPENVGPASRFAAATFTYSEAAAYPSPFAADYAALTAGVKGFPIVQGASNDRSRVYGSKNVLNRYGSIALLETNAFPLIVEPSGNRLIFAAAGIYEGNPQGARCVAFAHEQFGHVPGDGRMALFENAIQWAARKRNPADIVIALSTNLNADYFVSRGYQVQLADRRMRLTNDNPMAGCDVLVVDFDGPYTERFMTRAMEHVANGGGLVVTYLPWRDVHSAIKPMFNRVNKLLEPFGMAYRSSLTRPVDYGFTNIQAVPYPPILFNAFPAAELLRDERRGQIKLTSLEKAIAMSTIAYAADRQPDRLAALTAAYTGSTNLNGAPLPEVLPGNFTDVLALGGAQADANRLGNWQPDGNDLICLDQRGSVEYSFDVFAADIYRIQIVAAQNIPQSPYTNFILNVSVDDVRLGKQVLTAAIGVSGKVEFLTPYLTPGKHRLRVVWDDYKRESQLRLQSVHVQTGYGADSDADEIKDWVESLVDSESGLDITNQTITSYVSPMCLEGRDPYPDLIEARVTGADDSTGRLKALPAPDGRFYTDVPLARDGEVTLQMNYQNGAKSEVRSLQWLPVNVLKGGNFTIRKRDRLLLIAQPDNFTKRDNGTVQFAVGTNQYPTSPAVSKFTHRFQDAGVFTVTATYTSERGATQNGAITVNVVEHEFAESPACWVGEVRTWDVSLPSEAVLEADARLFINAIAPLPESGWRTSLIIDQGAPRYLLSRLGERGTVLSSGVVCGFDFRYGADTYIDLVDVYSDNSRLLEMLLVLSPVPADVTVRLDISVGGVVFDDGTVSKELTAADFDALGNCRVRLIRPAGTKTSVCHSIRLLQGATQIGYIQ